MLVAGAALSEQVALLVEMVDIQEQLKQKEKTYNADENRSQR